MTPSSGPDATDYNAGWHTFAVDWRPGRIIWYVDGQEIDRYESADVTDEAMYVILNLAMGDGFQVGAPVTEETADTLDDRPFQIDYVRMYDIPGVTQAPRAGVGDGASVKVFDASNPVEFSIEVSGERFGDGEAPYVVLASAETFADALAGTPLLGRGPLLLVDDQMSDGGPVDVELDRVLAEDGFVYVLGGTSAVTWEPRTWPVSRLAGTSRFETAAAIHDEVAARAFFGRPANESALLARAFGTAGNASAAFADSITGGGYAAATGRPVLLTDTGSLHPAAEAALAGVGTTYLLGGTAALSDAVERGLASTVRIDGPSRDATAVAMLDGLWGGDASTNRIVIDGYDEDAWGWGLVAAGLAADQSAPILVTSAAAVPASTLAAITAADSDVLLIGDFTQAERDSLVEELNGAIAARQE